MRQKRKNRLANSMVFAILVSLVMNALCILLVSFSARYSTIDPMIYTMFVATSVGLILLMNILLLLGYGVPIRWMRKAFVFVSLVFVLVGGYATYYVYRLNTGFDRLVSLTDSETVQYSVIAQDPSLVGAVITSDFTVGYVSGDEAFNELLHEQISLVSGNATVRAYDNYGSLLQDFLKETSVLDMAVVPAQYGRLAENMERVFQDQLNQSVVVGSFDLSLAAQTSTVKVLEEPFTVLIMGVNENLADSIMLVTVNPKTLTATLTSLARDSYVPIACYANNSKDKLNHSHGRSRQCMIDTIENYMQVDVDFFFEADFYALVKIVDAMGGLELTSPITFSGSIPLEGVVPVQYKEVTVNEGTYVMTGEQVLTFARERYHFPRYDFDRQLNQQYIMRELIFNIVQKARTNPNVLVDVLDAAYNNIVMNLSMEQDIAPFLGFILNVMNNSPVDLMSTFTINQTQIIGGTPNINGVSVVTPYRDSVLEARALIQATLTGEPSTNQLGFTINEPYSGFVLKRFGTGDTTLMYPSYGSSSPITTPEVSTTPEPEETPATPEPEETTPTTPETSVTVPTFTSRGEAATWASNHGVTLSVNVIDKDSPSYKDVYANGQVIYQSIDPGVITNLPATLVISVVEISDEE